MSDPRYRRSHTISVPLRDTRYSYQQRSTTSENDWEWEPILGPIAAPNLPMTKAFSTSPKIPKKIWDSDKALKSTHTGLYGKHQIRAYLFLALGYAVIAGWLTRMPTFALLPPKYIDCTPYYPNQSTVTTISSSSFENNTQFPNYVNRTRREPVYNYSTEYGRSVLTDFNTLCDKSRLKTPYIVYTVGLTLGAIVFGYMADYSGRKMVLLGSLWAACVLSIFQLLSDDYISYVFFMLFVGSAVGAVNVITMPVVMEMFPIKTRTIYSMALLGAVVLFDLIMPWLAFGIKNWKILQAVISIPLFVTAALQWFMEESMFWHTSQKDYTSAILSLIKIAQYNGITFEKQFHETNDFLHSKRSKAVQCDLQPLLRLEDIKAYGSKYPDVDMVELQTNTSKDNTLKQRILNAIKGSHYLPTSSTFYPTDFLHSPILSIYFFVLCGLWLVSSLTEYGLDAPHLTQHLSDSFHANYFYTHLIQIISFIIACPLIYLWGRRWPTFCFFLTAEVCLLASVAVKLDNDQTRAGMLVVYFTGKIATRAAFFVLIIYTCEMFPTGLRCTMLGLCYTFRLIGIALASPDIGELNDWMPRLIYGVLSLVLGSMALLLPETKSIPLPRTMLQIENIPTSLSKSFRRHRQSALMEFSIKSDRMRAEEQNNFNDAASGHEGVRASRPFDNQSTMHSIFELQDYAGDDTMHAMHGRYSSRRMDLPHPSFFQLNAPNNSEMFRYPQSIAEDAEYTDEVDNNQPGIALQHRLSEQKRLNFAKGHTPITNDEMILAREQDNSSGRRSSAGNESQNQDVPINRPELVEIVDRPKNNDNQDSPHSSSPKLRRTRSDDENYFSEHC